MGVGFHAEVIAPLVGDVGYAAGLLGWGSDVLGYDTERSTDHGWGPRVVVLVDAAEVERVRGLVDAELPEEYQGFAVRFGRDGQEPGHHVTVATLGDWLPGHLGFDATQGIGLEDWLVTPQLAWMRLVAPIARPVFSWNHKELMDEGAAELARLMGTRLLRPPVSELRPSPRA